MEITKYIESERIEEFKSVGDDFLVEILEIFKKSSGEVHGHLLKAFENKDIDGIKMHAHSLKGAILNIGFTELSKQIDELNILAKEGDLEQIGKVLPVFTQEMQRILDLI